MLGGAISSEIGHSRKSSLVRNSRPMTTSKKTVESLQFNCTWHLLISGQVGPHTAPPMAPVPVSSSGAVPQKLAGYKGGRETLGGVQRRPRRTHAASTRPWFRRDFVLALVVFFQARTLQEGIVSKQGSQSVCDFVRIPMKVDWSILVLCISAEVGFGGGEVSRKRSGEHPKKNIDKKESEHQV